METNHPKSSGSDIPIDKALALQIAQDTLANLPNIDLRSRSGYIVDNLGNPWIETGPLKDHIDKLEKNCFLCLLSAMFLSYVRIKNNVNFEDLKSFGLPDSTFLSQNHMVVAIKTKLREAFSAQEIFEMEVAFECYGRGDSPVSKFGHAFLDDDSRAIGILENVIINKGYFVL